MFFLIIYLVKSYGDVAVGAEHCMLWEHVAKQQNKEKIILVVVVVVAVAWVVNRTKVQNQ